MDKAGLQEEMDFWKRWACGIFHVRVEKTSGRREIKFCICLSRESRSGDILSVSLSVWPPGCNLASWPLGIFPFGSQVLILSRCHTKLYRKVLELVLILNPILESKDFKCHLLRPFSQYRNFVLVD